MRDGLCTGTRIPQRFPSRSRVVPIHRDTQSRVAGVINGYGFAVTPVRKEVASSSEVMESRGVIVLQKWTL